MNIRNTTRDWIKVSNTLRDHAMRHASDALKMRDTPDAPTFSTAALVLQSLAVALDAGIIDEDYHEHMDPVGEGQ